MSYSLDTEDVSVNAGEDFRSRRKGEVSTGGVRKKGGKKKQTAAAIDAVESPKPKKERSDGEKKRRGDAALVSDDPLTWENWATDISWAPLVPENETARFESTVKQMVGFTSDMKGAETFSRMARWFRPEINLDIISERLGVPREELEKYRSNYCKRCYQASSDFAKEHVRSLVLNGWSISAALPIPIQHACLCAVLDDGEVFVFDLVRDEQFYLYGVALRRDFEEALTALDTFCESGAAEFVVDGLNCLQMRARDGEELRDVLEKNR